MRNEKSTPFKVLVHDELCKGEECGVCSKSFRCPALVIDSVQNKARIREDACSGCGVCVEVCPFSAISKEDVK